MNETQLETQIEIARPKRELLSAQTQLRELLDDTPAVIYRLKLEGQKIIPHVMSEGITRLLGFTVAETRSYEWWLGQLHPDDSRRVVAGISGTLSHGVSRTAYRLRHKNGDYRWVDDNRRLVRDSSGQPTELIGVWTDTTERKRSEQALRDSDEKFRRLAEMATGALHNAGNVLNSVNAAFSSMADSLKRSKAANLSKIVALLREHEGDLGTFPTSDLKGKQLPGCLAQLAGRLAGEHKAALKELAELQKNIEHIKEVVTVQQSCAKGVGKSERLQVTGLVEDILRMDSAGQAHHDMQVIKQFKAIPAITVEKHKVLQILMNLVRNAKQACHEAGPAGKRLTLRVTNGDDRVRIAVSDNGVGISLPESLARILAQGFTTEKDGHGFGLHSAVAAAKEMGGSLHAHSDGVGRGATFTLELPLTRDAEPAGEQAA